MIRSGFRGPLACSNQFLSSLNSLFRHRAWRWWMAIALVAVACRDSVTAPVDGPPTFSIEKAPTNSGDLQSDTVLATMPLRVFVRADGVAAMGVRVFWLVSANAVTETFSTVTDNTGIASLELTLGPKP